MIKRFAGRALVVAMALIAGPSFAADAAPAAASAPETVQLAEDHPTSYTVKPGDTLWGISQMFLKNPWQWPSIWHVNEQVANPHRIFPGDVLKLTWRDGKPSLERVESFQTENANVEVVDAETLKLRPRIRDTEVAVAIPAIPLRNVEVFLDDSRVVELEELRKAPYVIAGPERRVIMGNGDTLYVRATTPKWSESFPEFGVFRQGKPFIDPRSKEILGYEAKKIATARVLDNEGNLATMRVLSADEDIRIDDRLLLSDQRAIQSVFYPKEGPAGVTPEIIHIFGSIGYAGLNDVIVVNKGKREEVNVGHVFSVLQSGEVVRDRRKGDNVRLPPRRVGLAIVFRAFDKTAFALITRSTSAIRVGDTLGQPRIGLD
jgi:hypothetical protein